MWVKWLEETNSMIKTGNNGRRYVKTSVNVQLVRPEVERSPRRSLARMLLR